MSAEKPTIKEVKIKFIYPDDLKSKFTNNIIVQHQKDHFVISFFETFLPGLLGSKEEQKKMLEKIDHVESKCIARLIVTPEKMADFIKAMESNYNNYSNNFGLNATHNNK